MSRTGVAPRLSAFSLCLLLLSSLVIQPFFPTTPLLHAQPVAALTLDGVLTDLQSKLGTLLNQAQSAGTQLTLVVGQQVSAEIDLARQEFSTELYVQEAKISVEAETFVASLRQAITELQTSTFAKAQDLVNQLQLVAMTLPFRHTFSQVRAFSPIVQTVPPSGVDDLVFTVAGLFPNAGDKGYSPTFEFNGKVYPAADPTAFQASFHVPKQDVSFPTGSALQTLSGTVKAPYRHCFLFLFECHRVREFPELIGLLPASPGHLHLSISNTTQVTTNKIISSAVMQQDASHGDDPDHPQTYAADPGFEIIRDSVHITVLSSEGSWSVDFTGGNCSTTTIACWKVSTVQHHCVAFFCPSGHDGVLRFQLSFAETQTVPVTQSFDQDVSIAWNETTLKALPDTGAVQFKGLYTDFNGRTFAFGTGNLTVTSPYFRVSEITTTSLAFTTYPFSADAGTDLSGISDPRFGSVLANLQAKNGIYPNHNLNPLTSRGYATSKAFLAIALAKSPQPLIVQNPVVVQNLEQGFGGALLGADVVKIQFGGRPPPPSPTQTTVDAIQQSMTKNDTM